MRQLNLCLVRKEEVAPFAVDVEPFPGGVRARVKDLEPFTARFKTFIFEEATIAEAVHAACLCHHKKLAFAESCTGGSLAASLVAIPGASKYFLGSIVAYSNDWKERFLQVSHSTIVQEGAVSKSCVCEMIRGLFAETDADLAVAVSGQLGTSPGKVYLAIAERGKQIDVGPLQVGPDRAYGIELTVQTALGALWRRIVHHTLTLS